jgi:hypothetical protein
MKSVEHEDRLQRELAQKQQEVSAREYAQLDKQTRTQHSPFIDMRDAYAQVRNNNQDYPEEYKDYIRRTSGRPV